ncbi:MAG: FAD-dependent oxidoreductase [Nitratireductor sp.]|uniref:NAD(P)/FAD-dependent oxidoreductase n=1 Tax=Parasphingorhabdus sp. TaxID=2709688 RepID=UPI00328B7728
MAAAWQNPVDVAVIGGGIIGICAAAALAAAGRRPLIIDRTGICEETSAGNAGALAFSDVLPLAQKGMIRNLPKWLADPLGPLSVPPAYAPRLVPWLLRFLAASRPARYGNALAAQAAMMRLAETEWAALMARTGTESMLREDGSLELYQSDAEFQASLGGWAARERFNIAFRHLDRAGIEALQPGLAPQFSRATFVPGWKTVSDPQHLGKAIWRKAEADGAIWTRGEVVVVTPAEKHVAIQLREGRTLLARDLVVAAGAWSHRLTRAFGDVVPLETERGYNTTLPADAFDLRRQLIFSAHGFVVTPLETGIRVGGAVELGGLKRPPDYRRARAMLEKARRFMPALQTGGGREWMGYRPSLPDSLPVIGRARNAENVYYAFGHGHLGLTQAAATGCLIRDLVSRVTPTIDLAPFSPQRF